MDFQFPVHLRQRIVIKHKMIYPGLSQKTVSDTVILFDHKLPQDGIWHLWAHIRPHILKRPKVKHKAVFPINGPMTEPDGVLMPGPWKRQNSAQSTFYTRKENFITK